MARTKTKLTQSEKVNSTNATVFFEDNSLPSSKLKDFKEDGSVTWSSDLHIPSAKAIFTWAGSLFVKLANKITSWSAIPSNDNVPSEKLVKDSLDAKVTGAASSTDNAIPRFDGSTGKIIQNSAVVIDDNGRVGINTNTPTYKLDVGGTAATDGIRSCIGLDISPVPNPIAPTLINMTSGGSVDVGDHYYSCTYMTDLGETNQGGSIKITVTSPNQTVVIGVPISSDPRVTARRIFRTKSGGNSYDEYLLAVINDNTTSEYTDNIADSALIGSARPVYTRMNTTSKQITLNGVRALFIDYRNTIIGLSAGRNITTGGSNFLAGYSAGGALTTGYENVAILGLSKLTTGIGNVGIGSNSLLEAVTTGRCVGIGYYALRYCTGSNNVGIGSSVLSGITTAAYVVGLGTGAGTYIANGVTAKQTGNYGVYIGAGTKALSNGTENEVVIGYNAVGHGSNTVTLGHTTINKTVLRGDIETNSAKYQYIAASTTADTVNDIRVSNSTGSLKIEKCTVANASKGNGTWTDIPIGDVVGPSGATDNAIPRFDGSTGKIIQNSAVFIDDNGNMGINTVPVKPLDVNGMATFRDHVNIRHTKYIYLSPSPLNDTVNDIRISNDNGVYKIEKCTVANATKGSGTWTDIIIGDVVGPSGATADGIVLFDSTGKSLRDSGKKLSDYQTVVSEVAISSGNTYVITNNTEYRAAAAITTITFTAPASGNYECYVRFTTASTGTISVNFPNGIKGNPVIGNSETWEFSCKDGYTLAIQLS